ncbi:hypothetical protein E0Z10_g10517 [Xylaria hypoxylon]|uniref:RING-type domain-containing protein n=1 Tax=Xylaria hypoxylon TaxID=37992 RepID=A0A4Z0Y2U0_9PEZI|nr:hypothetical protein E0Z10_g10517 [Xylaria hypoxylon]
MSGNLDDIYSPNWVPYFNPEGNLHPDVTLSVECGICRTELAITKQPDDDHESFAMLPCGHVFGYQCIIEWFSRKPSCPVCRKNFRYHGCGHLISLRDIQGGSRFNIRRDLPEAMNPGEQLPDLCFNCRASRHTNNHQCQHRWQRPGTFDHQRIEEDLHTLTILYLTISSLAISYLTISYHTDAISYHTLTVSHHPPPYT